MIRLLHTADWHLDSPIAPGGPPHRREELLKTAEYIFSVADREKVDIILLSGDLFDNAGPHPGIVRRLVQLCGNTEKPVFIAPGNHDFFCSDSPYNTLHWPDNVTVFRDSRPVTVLLPALRAAVTGYAFTERHRTDDPLEGFVCPNDAMINIIIGHGDVTEGLSDYAPLHRHSLEQCGADYIALGHIHRCSPIQAGNWQYPGCPDGRHFGEAGDKSVIIAEVSKGTAKRKQILTSSRRYVELSAEAGGSDYPTAAVDGALEDIREEDVIRLTLTGESGENGVDTVSLALRYKDRFPYLTFFDSTELPRSLWKCAGADTVKGQFLSLLRDQMEAADEEKQQMLTLAARFGLAALEGREPPKEA